MDTRQHPLTPLAAAAGGALAGVAGTAVMDAVLVCPLSPRGR